MPVQPLDSREFVSAIQPLLERRDLQGLMHTLKSRWTCAELETLVDHGTTDAKKVAALSLGLVGTTGCCAGLSRLLRDHDPMVNKMAEHALWSIWFRGGTEEANHQLGRGAQALDRREFDHAIRHFSRAIELDPHFAEAYNQRALAYYFKDEYAESIRDCRATIERMPCHFGAWAGLGHCYAHLEQMERALEAYRQALEINPHLDCIRESVEELDRRLNTPAA
jgi:tetratricopeptide (TPR) repeat protein